MLLELITIMVASLCIIEPIRKIAVKKFNILHFCILAFYVMQVFPLLVKMVFGIDSELFEYPKMYRAMNDKITCIWYCIFVVFTISILLFLSKTIKHINKDLNSLVKKTIADKNGLRTLIFAGMFSQVFAIAVSENPKVYMTFSYFYMSRQYNLTDYLYHQNVVSPLNRLSLACVLLFYLYKKNSKMDWSIYSAIAVITWVSGKRTLLICALLGILVIDILKKEYKSNFNKLLLKVIIFASIVVGYFIIYSELTGKFSSRSLNYQYSIYFARMSTVDASIYDIIYDSNMMSYPGQSIIYDLCWWIPRVFWKSKPVIYSKYFTAYVMGYGTININWQFQINIWSEYISNFGILGPMIAAALLYMIAWISERSKNRLVYLSGLCFAVLYSMFGFEALNQILGVTWFGLALFGKFKKVKFRVRP